MSKKSHELTEAEALIKDIQNIGFVILTIMQDKLLTSVDLVSQFLQGKEAAFRKKRQRRKKKNFDEICEDDRLTDSEHYFQTAVFFHGIDTVISQLSCSFEGMRAVTSRFRCIHQCALKG